MLAVFIWEFNEPVQKSGTVALPAFRAMLQMKGLLLFIFITGLVPEVNSVLFYVLKRDIQPV